MPRGLLVSALAILVAWVGAFGLAGAGDAQQSAQPRRIGVILVGVALDSSETQAFREGLKNAGYVEGRDIVIDWRPANGDYARTPELAADLVQRKVEVIVVESTPAAKAAKRATGTIPIVMALVSDPVGSELVASLARPGGNVTGLTNQTADLTAKRLQLLKEAIPTAKHVAVVFNSETPPNRVMIRRLADAAPKVGVDLREIPVGTAEELRTAFRGLNRSNTDAVFIVDDGFMAAHREEILQLETNARLPIVYADTVAARRGVLLSYGVSHPALFYRAATYYVDKILKGAIPANLPVEQPTKFELVVNLKTAKALGITIPESILLRADEVIK
jgi:putative ABC transport system substrate-binding protein